MTPYLLVFVLGLGGGIFAGHWKPLAFLAPKPPTAQLTALQNDLDKAKADAAARENTLLAAKAKEQADLLTQLKAAQQMQEGASLALARVPVVHVTPELSLGQSLLLRSNIRLAAAIGRLPADMQAEILAIVDQALSTVQAERDTAQAALAIKDAEFKQVTADREQIKAQLPVLAARAAAAEEAKAKLETAVTQKTNEVKTWADAKAKAEAAAGSLMGSLDHLWHVILWVGGIYLFLALGLPGIVKHMASSPLKNGLRAVSGYATSPLLFHDAATKIETLTKSNP